MQSEIFTLCDHAQEIAGKLIIIGSFDTINVDSIPAIHPTCSIAMRVRFNRDETGKHKIQIVFTDSDKQNVIPPINGEVDVIVINDNDFSILNFAITLGAIKFDKLGKYNIELKIDDKWKANLPLILAKR